MRKAVASTVAGVLAVVASADSPVMLAAKPWVWQDDTGKTARIADWSDSPVVLTMFYGRCQVRCPATVARLRQLETSLAQRGVTVHFILVTLDPSNDSAERLGEFRASHRLPLENWHLLRGAPAQTDELGRLLKVRASPDDVHVLHDVRIALLGRSGVVQQVLSGFELDPASVAARWPTPEL